MSRVRRPATTLLCGLAVLVGLLVPGTVSAATPTPAAAPSATETATGYVVVLRHGQDVDAFLASSGRRQRIIANLRYRTAIKGFSASLTPRQAAQLRADPAVSIVAPDVPVHLSQITTPLVKRVGATLSPEARIDTTDGDGERVDVDVAIIDTGIQPNHPDLNVVGGYSCVTSSPTAYGDGYGHGTHVAGIVGALDNAYGVVGVAPGARLWAVRVFDSDGNSKLSWVLCGIDWVASQRDPLDPSRPLIEVANMSLRHEGGDDSNCGLSDDDPWHEAICEAVNAGITFVVAAGNDSTSAAAWRPASYNEVITVSALADFDGLPGGLAKSTCSSFDGPDVDDTFANFSNYGSDVDIIAPGKCVLSTWKGSSYRSLSGTSMASPAVAGGAALYKASHPDASPAEVRLALIAAASDDWRWTTDPDSFPDRLLDVSSFGAVPDLRLQVRGSAGMTIWTGGPTGKVQLRLVRGNGYAGAVDLAIDGLPSGVTADLDDPTPTGLGHTSPILSLTADDDVAPGTYPITVTATGPDLPDADRSVTISLRVGTDTVPPTATKPSTGLASATTLGSGSYLRIAYSGSDATSGVDRIQIQESVAGGAWTSVGTVTGASRAFRTVVNRGVPVQFRIRAIDRAGNVGAWMTGNTTKVTGYAESTSLARYSGKWGSRRYPTSWGGVTRRTSRSGASVTVTFTGRQIGLIAPKGPTRSSFRVYVDGHFVGTSSLYRSGGLSRQVVYVRSWSSVGRHVIRFVNAASRGRPWFEVDGFVVAS